MAHGYWLSQHVVVRTVAVVNGPVCLRVDGVFHLRIEVPRESGICNRPYLRLVKVI